MCTCPNYMYWRGDWTINDKPKLLFCGHHQYDDILKHTDIPFIQVPCGKCLECRIQYARSWADRCVLEAKKYKHNYFVTLTYDDEHLPPNGSLNPYDVTKFIKRLRKFMKKKYNHDGVRFLYSGEYGDSSMRPHYHIILFNCPLFDLTDVFQMFDKKQGIYVNHIRPDSHEQLKFSRTIYDLWTQSAVAVDEFGRIKLSKKGHLVLKPCNEHLGNISVGQFNYDTCAYVSQYVTKKCNPNMEKKWKDLGLYPEFLCMSRNPGIGGDYFEENDDGVYSTHLIIPAPGEAHKSATPRYFDKLFIKKYGDDVFQPIRSKRLIKKVINKETYLHSNYNYDKQNALKDYNLKKRKRLREGI